MVQGTKKYIAGHINYVLFQTRNEVHHSQNANYSASEENLSHPFPRPHKVLLLANKSHRSMCPYSISQRLGKGIIQHFLKKN